MSVRVGREFMPASAGHEVEDDNGQGRLHDMTGKMDQVKGRGKEAVGTLTGDKNLESEGTSDRRSGEAKQKLDNAQDKVEDTIEKTKGKADEVIDKAKDVLQK